MARTRIPLLLIGLAAAAAGAWSFLAPGGTATEGAADGSDGRLLRPVSASRQPPNLVVLVLDTLRADAVDPGPVGGPPAETPMPYLSSLAARGTLFRQASST